MADLASHAKVFASPVHGDATGVVRKLALARLEVTRRRLIKALVAERDDDAATALAAFTAGTDTAWRPEIGLALIAHRERSTGLAALQLAAAYAGMGGEGSIHRVVASACWLYFDGWLLAMQGVCDVTARKHAISIVSDLGTTRFTRADDRWLPDAPAGPWHAHATGSHAPRYVTVSGLQHFVEGFPWIAFPPPAPSTAPVDARTRIARIHHGWQFIVEYTPQFAAWIAATAAGCLLLEPSTAQQAQSVSSSDRPGLIAFEPPDSPAYCGELLVHECAHQHMMAYAMAIPLATPGCQEMYYSPIKRAHRTVDRVMTGAHAVGNVILYYEALRRSVPLDAESAHRLTLHKQWFEDDYRPAFDASTSLTAAGQQFWRSLCDSVQP